MINIKEQLIKHLGRIYINEDWDFIVCGHVSFDDDDDNQICLLIDGDVEEFLNKLDFEITNYRSTDIWSTIWYADGTWSEYVYDFENSYGYWERHICPKIPKYLHKEGE